MVAAFWLGVPGGVGRARCPWRSPQVTGSLRSTPRGSNSTMSKSSSSCGVSEPSSLAMSSMPETPGPPGSMTSDPMRGRGVLGRMARHRDGDGRAVRMRVVQRDDEGAALQIAVARGPGHRGHRAVGWSMSWSCCVVVAGGGGACALAPGSDSAAARSACSRPSPRRRPGRGGGGAVFASSTPGQALHVPFPP